MRKILLATSLGLVLATAAAATTAPLTPGNLVVAVSGKGASGTTYTDNQASPLSLYQYTPTGTNTVSFAGKSIVTGSVNPISSEYGSSSEGLLQRSGDGKSLTIMGYAIDAATFDYVDPQTKVANAIKYVPQTDTNKGKLTALAQSTSIAGGTTVTNNDGTTSHYDPIARVVADIYGSGAVDTSTALYGVFDQNNPRSAWTQNGNGFYVSGQGVSGDTTGGVFLAKKGASSATPISGLDTSGGTAGQDTRDVQVYAGQLYVSADTKSGSGSNRDYIGTLGTGEPTDLANGGAGPTMLIGYGDGKGAMTMTAATGNGLNAGKTINLSPEQFFFANQDTLYVTDTGQPKNGANSTSGVGDGGLQKWEKQSDGSWKLEYTLAAGLGLVKNSASAGVTGLFGLAGQVNADGTVSLYATSYTINDLDKSYLYGITDTLAATTGAGESFAVLDSSTDSKFMGVAFAPDVAVSPAPEPASWALMIGGFGLVGGALRRRRGGIATV